MKNIRFFRHIHHVTGLVMIVIASIMVAELRSMPQPSDAVMPAMSGPEDVPSTTAAVVQPELYKPAETMSNNYPSNEQSTRINGFKVSTVLGGLGVENNTQVNRLVKEAEETSRRLELDVEAKVASLKQAAEESVAQMKADIEHQAMQLKQEAVVEAQRAQQRAERQTEQLFQQASEHAAKITQKVEDEAIELKKDAVMQVVNIINQADEESLKLRKKEREESLERHLSRKQSRPDPEAGLGAQMQRPALFEPRAMTQVSKQPVPREWRRAMTGEFNANTLLMKQIILEGEDAEQVPDFLKRFTEQHKWFDNTLRGTQYVDDDNYRQVVNKQVRLRKVIDAQRKADAFLADVTLKIKLSDYEHKKVRLLSLYELNSFAQRELFKVDAQKAEFTDPVIQQLVLKVAHEVTGRVKKAYPDFRVLDDNATLKLATGALIEEHAYEVKKLQTLVDDAKHEKRIVRSKTQQKLEDQGKELAEYQLMAKRLERELEHVRQQGEVERARSTDEMRERMKREFSVKLEEKERDSLDLKLQLTSAHQRLEVLDREVKEAKDRLDRMNIELLMAKDDARLAKKHVDDLQKEVEEQRKLKNLALDKVKLIDEVADRRIEEHVGIAAQRMSADRQELNAIEAKVKDKEAALKKAEQELQDKERLLSRKEQEVEDQRKSLQDMRKTIDKDRDALSDIRNETKAVMSKFSQLTREHEKDVTSLKGASQVVTEAANRQVLKSELKEKKHDQVTMPSPTVAAPMVGASSTMGTGSMTANPSATKKM